MAISDEQLREYALEIRTLGEMLACLMDDQPRTIHMSQESQNQSVLIQFRFTKPYLTLKPLRRDHFRTKRMKDIADVLDEEERRRRRINYYEGPPTNHPRDEIVGIEDLRLWFLDDVKKYLTFGQGYSYANSEGRRVRRLTETVCNFLSQTNFSFLETSRRVYTTIWETALAIELLQLLKLKHVASNITSPSTTFIIPDIYSWGYELIDELEGGHKELTEGCLSNLSPSFQRLKKEVDTNMHKARNLYRSMI